MRLIMSVFFILLSVLTVHSQIRNGADKIDDILKITNNRNVAFVVNQTSCLTDGTHLLDTLLSLNVKIKKVFAPEHGFRGDQDAGALVQDGIDQKTGLKYVSLYGKNYKPTPDQLKNIDIVIFDIQDVGARFYTYISTMHNVMEACAEQGKECIILDRPNPNDHVQGPVLKPAFSSFVGKHSIPVLHGLTVGELAKMINGEGWLKNRAHCKLTVIPIDGWVHGQQYSLPIKPSPNLPNDQSIKLYPSLVFFEATNISIGRGTYFPFQVIGYPNPKYGKFQFTPKTLKGFDMNPLQKDKVCYGVDLSEKETSGEIELTHLISFYKKSGLGSKFFTSPRFMDLLAGNDSLRKQIIAGKSEAEIKKTWETDLNKYKELRRKYLIYPDNR